MCRLEPQVAVRRPKTSRDVPREEEIRAGIRINTKVSCHQPNKSEGKKLKVVRPQRSSRLRKILRKAARTMLDDTFCHAKTKPPLQPICDNAAQRENRSQKYRAFLKNQNAGKDNRGVDCSVIVFRRQADEGHDPSCQA